MSQIEIEKINTLPVLIQILAKAQSLKTAKEVRHLIKDYILQLQGEKPFQTF